MLFSVNVHDPVLMAVSMHRGKLIEVLRTAVRAHPGHADGDGSAQTFLVRNETKLVGTFSPERLTAMKI